MDGSEGDLRLTLQTLNIHGQHSWASCVHACARVFMFDNTEGGLLPSSIAKI